MRICSQTANIHASASSESETTSQALLGEHVNVLKTDKQWSLITLQTDDYTGYLENHHISDSSATNTHWVINKLTPLFTKPDIKSAVKQLAPLASELCLHECENDQFLRTDQCHYIWKQHTRAINDTAAGQLVDTAQALFLGSPYLWGGRSPLGLDCSAVVQLTAQLHGWYLPRDTSDQVALFRSKHSVELPLAAKKKDDNSRDASLKQQLSNVQWVDYADKQTNDLVYWPGHVAIMLNTKTLVHATAHTLQCCCESLSAVEARAGTPESIWRLTR